MIQFLQKSLQVMRCLSNVKPLFRSISSYSNPNIIMKSNLNISMKLSHQSLLIQNTRSLFLYRSGDMLWEGVTGPPGRIKKRARGKRRVVRNKINLNYGRKLGYNEMNYKYPGLNSAVVVNNKVIRKSVGEKDEEYEQRLMDFRTKQNKKRRSRYLPPLKRGWTSGNFGGQSIGPPPVTTEQMWEGFDCRILETKVVCCMNSSKGRFRRFTSFVIVGNGKGLAGIAKARSANFRSSINVARKRAALRLESYDLRESRTLWHPDYLHAQSTRIYIEPKMKGEGLVCHRVIKTMCQLIGIKDMYAKVEGATRNYQMIAKIFTALLRRQETYQQLANRLSLNVVETCSETDNFPVLLAAPESGITRTPGPEENLDFNRLHMDGKVFMVKKREPFYLNMPGQVKKRKARHKFRNLLDIDRSYNVLEFLAKEGFLNKKSLLIDSNKS